MHSVHMHVYQCGGTHGCTYILFNFLPVPVIITMTKCNLGGKGFILVYTSRVQSIRRKVRAGIKTETMEEHWVTLELVLSYHSYTTQAHLPRDCTTHSGQHPPATIISQDYLTDIVTG